MVGAVRPAPGGPPVFTAIDHVVFVVSDPSATAAWYRQLFGLETEHLDELAAGTKPFASVRVSDGFIIDLLPGDPDADAGRAGAVDHVAFVVDAASFDRFAGEHGELFEGEPKMISGARGQGLGGYLRDPDGHRIEVRTYPVG